MKDSISLQYHQNDLINLLNQIDALLTLAVSVDYTEIKPAILLNYLSVIVDIAHKARDIAERLFEKLPKDLQ